MPSKATGHVVSDDRRAVTVTVAHRDVDSFSRSVDPTAMRYANRTIGSWPRPAPGEQWALVDAEYAPARANHGRDCQSFIRFELRTIR